MQKLVVLSGAGISAESGLKTFRDSNGLWEGHDVMEVASPQGWSANPELVLDFYNQRRKQALTAQPNDAHKILADLEAHFEVQIITQNVDNLHEKAGSSNVLHLHGELFQSRSTADENLVYTMDNWELKLGDLCERGSQLRPNIVWFGEAVPMMEPAIRFSQQADIFLVVGTSLQVYPAASLIDFVSDQSRKYLIDPKPPGHNSDIVFIPENATSGMGKLKKMLSL
ncbi:NAD-dependent deacylase [Roseivirga sp. E12]|uniref:SIR2 family NAD-dependent protein deacylase n=1 Tax=Roseivirga sp. E12 TaxID=2819237 RepID=UPI001ABCF0AE|nr:NAD-dependent deacylase [Roseivirga sp. E12]MBO3697039.1 NAD-dependent deacylase [Roseivirga sp. E12]